MIDCGMTNCRGVWAPVGSSGRAPVLGWSPQKQKHFYNCDVKLWANFVVYFFFSVFYF